VTRTALVWFALSLAVLPGAAQETVLEILTVRNRPAESLLGDLLPLAGPNGSVTASGSKLIVNAAPAALARIKRVLAELDVVPRSLWITVSQGDASRMAGSRTEVTGRVDAPGGRTRTVVTGAFAQQGASSADETVQRIRAVEGLPALIRAGRSLTVPTAVLEAETGLYVRPLLAGDFVTLEVAATKEAFDAHGRVEGQRLVTTVSGRLGEWITIGGLSRDAEASGRGERRQAAEERVVRVLVEEVR
jgi:hypothetical protein